MTIFIRSLAAVLSVACAHPVSAKIIDESDTGFTVAHSASVRASPAEVWDVIRRPQKWWLSEHSWSGDAENLWLDLQAGGCLCEKLPDDGEGIGSVQHARIIFAKPNAMLRLSGALGPLQSEAVTGTLTIMIKATPIGAAVRFEYVVGGYMRLKSEVIRPAVDAVMGIQLNGLANALGGALSPGFEEKDVAVDVDKAEAAQPDGAASTPRSHLESAVTDPHADAPERP